jgi:ribonucleoside-diphosphate reductase alpha chain
LISLALRAGINQDEIIYQLKGIRCPSPTLAEGGAVLSCADAIAKALENYERDKMSPDLFKEVTAAEKAQALEHADASPEPHHQPQLPQLPVESLNKRNLVGSCPQCPECGEMLEFGEGCAVCRGCGYSKCW